MHLGQNRRRYVRLKEKEEEKKVKKKKIAERRRQRECLKLGAIINDVCLERMTTAVSAAHMSCSLNGLRREFQTRRRM